MKAYRSSFADLAQQFEDYRKASGAWSEQGLVSLRLFDNYCADHYGSDKPLNQEMVDEWCAHRDTETNTSTNKRTQIIVTFLKFLNERKLSEVKPPKRLKEEPSNYQPHFFTNSELKRFFQTCDNLFLNSSQKKKIATAIPCALYRLLYSSGIRTTEARWLKREDFIKKEGVLNIRKSKGNDQHYVALDPSMKSLLIKYDEYIDFFLPDRTFLFEIEKGKNLKTRWVTDTFHKIWKQTNGNSNRVVPYHFRHNYAITNINKWNIDVFCDIKDLHYLSKSMGHREISSTLHYYFLAPSLVLTLEEKTQSSLNSTIPEVHYEEE